MMRNALCVMYFVGFVLRKVFRKNWKGRGTEILLFKKELKELNDVPNLSSK